MPATPHCPYCNAQGLNHLALQRLDGFGLVYCGNCGAIYGVVPLPAVDRLSKSANQPANPPSPLVEVEKRASSLPPKSLRHPLNPHLSSPKENSSQNEFPPLSSPPVGLETKPAPPVTEPSSPPIVAAPSVYKPPTGALDEVGASDLSHKLPYDPEAIANRMRVAGTGQGSRFLRVAVDVGPPLCPQHKIEMVKTTIPAGYQNAGREVWLCPHFKNCREWELAK